MWDGTVNIVARPWARGQRQEVFLFLIISRLAVEPIQPAVHVYWGI
jgi:hypothetical protein